MGNWKLQLEELDCNFEAESKEEAIKTAIGIIAENWTLKEE